MPDYYTQAGFFRAQRILRLVANNPKEANSASFDRFENYFRLPNDGSDTVARALEAGVELKDITYDWKHGHIALGDKEVDSALAKRAR